MDEENEKVFYKEYRNRYMVISFPPQYLAILFFLNNYNGHLPNLPGVVHDEKELTEVLKSYQKKVINSSKNVLEDLREILQACKQKEYERIHFHFSGKIQRYR